MSLFFFASDENQLPRIMAAVKTEIILTSVIKFSKDIFLRADKKSALNSIEPV